MILTARRCRRCKKLRDLVHFHKKTASRDGYQDWCIECSRTARRLYRNKVICVEPESGTRWCGGCDRTLPLASFWRASGTKDGCQTRCKTCSRAATNAWRRRKGLMRPLPPTPDQQWAALLARAEREVRKGAV